MEPIPNPLQLWPFERPVWRDWRWGPATIRILILTDNASYNETDPFGLGIMLSDAFDSGHPDYPQYALFDFTKAHRDSPPPSAGISRGFSNFRFTPGSLDDFDQLWLFGGSAAAPYLSPQEIEVVESFMDAGGGILAMGDHEDLGLGLCGGIKRIRSMRKWWFESPQPPPNMLKAPDNRNLTRNDTVQAPRPSGDVNRGRQTDAIPQPIHINYRRQSNLASFAGGRWALGAQYPHPVLCGPRGPIRVLPDHQHEGDCIVPDPAFADEYPGGQPVEILAYGRNVVGRRKPIGDNLNQIIEPREFGLIGAWEGHSLAGRVLVDSTWHHWYNMNLRGLRSEDGVEYADILAYFRNVAVWLASTDKQAQMRRAGQLVSFFMPTFVETGLTLRKLYPIRFFEIGTLAIDALGKVAPFCQAALWYQTFVRPHLPGHLLDQIENAELIGTANDLQRVALDKYLKTIFGGVVNAIAVAVNEQSDCDLTGLCNQLDDIASAGGLAGAQCAMETLRKETSALKEIFVDACLGQ